MNAIIGGTGVYSGRNEIIKEIVETKYGNVELDIMYINGERVVFLARHGSEHSLPPHLINYRANMMALKNIGVKHIYATAAVGSCNENYEPGDIVVVNDFIDFTKSRPVTFFDGGIESVKHVDMSDPYCKNMRKRLYEVSKELGLKIKGDAVYLCTEGPRFETASEINMYKQLRADVVGMTNVPEVVLAKELGMCYSTIGIISNWCTGVSGEFTIHDIKGAIDVKKDIITSVFMKIFNEGLDQENCNCNNSIIEL